MKKIKNLINKLSLHNNNKKKLNKIKKNKFKK